MEWISVDDRLPEAEVSVLCWDKARKGDGVYEFFVCWRKCRRREDGSIQWEGPQAWDMIGLEVTHWMPLPKPPEK